MSIRVEADVTNLHAAAEAAGVADEIMIDEMLEAVRYATLTGWAEAAEDAPVFLGFLAGSIRGTLPSIETRGEMIHITADFHTGAYEWAVIMEYGRKYPGRYPPYMMIWRWVDLKIKRGQFHLDIREGETYDHAVDRAVFLVMRKIAQFGTDPREYMKSGADAAEKELEKLVWRGAEYAVDRFVMS